MPEIPSDSDDPSRIPSQGAHDLDEALDLRLDYIKHQLDVGGGGAAGGGRFAFGTALEPVGHRRFGGC